MTNEATIIAKAAAKAGADGNQAFFDRIARQERQAAVIKEHLAAIERNLVEQPMPVSPGEIDVFLEWYERPGQVHSGWDTTRYNWCQAYISFYLLKGTIT